MIALTTTKATAADSSVKPKILVFFRHKARPKPRISGSPFIVNGATTGAGRAAIAEHQQGDVVVGLTTGPVLGGGVEQRPPDGLGVPAPETGQRALNTLHAELLALRRERLGDAIAVENNRVAGRQLHRRRPPTWPSAAGRGSAPGAARVPPSRWLAERPAGSGRRSRGSGSRRRRSKPRPRVRNRFPGLCLRRLRLSAGIIAVDGLAQLVKEADEALRHRHDQRRPHPLARDVPQGHREAPSSRSMPW